MASSPSSVNSTFRPSGERPIVSGLGLSDGSEASEGPELVVDSRAAPTTQAAANWEQPRPSKKELWRQRRGSGGQFQGPAARQQPRREVSPEMEGLCFKCFEEGHRKIDCKNKVVCLRCGLPGHESKDCKRPRSPSSEEDLRRAALAKVARRGPAAQSSRPGQGARGQQEPPPPPAVSAQEDNRTVWPSLPYLRMETARHEESQPSELCIVRRTRAMEDLERRLQFAMVAYVGGARRDISPEFVVGALGAEAGISPEWFSVHEYRPEDFLVVFARQEHRSIVGARPSFDHKGVRLFFRQWNRQAQAVHSVMRYKVSLVLEGIPPHAWEREVVEDLLGSAYLVDMVAPETSARRDLSAFKLSAWTADPEGISSLRWMAVPEPGLVAPLADPELLQYKVLIHVDSVTEFDRADEPWFLRASSGSDQSGIPDADGGSMGARGGGPRSYTRRPPMELRSARSAPSWRSRRAARRWCSVGGGAAVGKFGGGRRLAHPSDE